MWRILPRPHADGTIGHIRTHSTAGRSRVLVSAAVLAALIAFVGFWPTYFGPLVSGNVDVSSLLHIHAAVQTAWLALFVMQIVLASTGHLALHMQTGRWIMAFSVVVCCFSLVVIFERFAGKIAAGEVANAQRQLFGHLREVVWFAAFVLAGWLWRGRPETHKRLMLIATVLLIHPAVGRRMTFLPQPVPLLLFMIVWGLPIYLMMIYDYAKQRIVHPVYVIGVLAMLAERLVLPLRTTGTWMTISGWLAQLYQSRGAG